METEDEEYQIMLLSSMDGILYLARNYFTSRCTSPSHTVYSRVEQKASGLYRMIMNVKISVMFSIISL